MWCLASPSRRCPWSPASSSGIEVLFPRKKGKSLCGRKDTFEFVISFRPHVLILDSRAHLRVGSSGYRSAESAHVLVLGTGPLTSWKFSSSSHPYFWGHSQVARRMRPATGFSSLAMVLNPSRDASKGMDPPPAVMSNTTGFSVTKFWFNHSRSVSDKLCVKARGLEKP